MTHPDFQTLPDVQELVDPNANQDDLPPELGGGSAINEYMKQVKSEVQIVMAIKDRIKYLEALRTDLQNLDQDYSFTLDSIEVCKGVLSDLMSPKNYNEALDELYNRG